MKDAIAKTMKTLQRQRILIVMIVFSVSLLLLVGVTYAYFIKTDRVTNVLRSQDLPFSFKVDEIFKTPESVTPGQTVEKVVNVTNTGDEAGFLRVLVLTKIIAADGTVLEAIPGTTFTLNGLNTTDWSPDSTKMWADGKDGYYYYLDKLDSKKMTSQPLFESVTLAAGLPAEYKGATLEIEVKVEASETSREAYRNGWWGCGDSVPASPELVKIDDVLRVKAK
jgi:alternate signal-mediated exported protein